MDLTIDSTVKMDIGVSSIIFDSLSSFSSIGHGAYFADDPRRSHGFADPNAEHTRVMFFNKVLLGNQFVDYNGNRELVSAPHGYHSVLGTGLEYTEYIVYRYGQALPYLKMTYTV